MKNSDKVNKAIDRMNSKQKPFKDRSEGSRKVNKHLRLSKDFQKARDIIQK